MNELGLVLLCYIIGAVPFSYIFSRFLGGVDIRDRGTGNVGATNVLRSAGKKIALAAFIGDTLKGVISAWIGLRFGGLGLAALCSVAAVVGHCWPVFLGFRGGKGVSTAFGIVVYLMPLITAILAVIFFPIVFFSRYVSLGSVCVAAILPVLVLIMQQRWQYIIMSLVMAGIVICRHRANIERLRNGTEKKITEKAN